VKKQSIQTNPGRTWVKFTSLVLAAVAGAAVMVVALGISERSLYRKLKRYHLN